MIGKEIGNYCVVDLIGKGGMAVVYRGQHKTLARRIVAIKMLSAALEGDRSFHDRFFREAEVMDRLRHPNIVTLYDFIQQKGQYFIVMEYVDGTTLHHMIKEAQGALPPDQISQIFKQVLSAIGYAHKLGIVHRDIKPSNIMINQEGQVKITDFGIARILGENFETTLTATGMGMGSPYYMSPEQVLASKDHPITAASDIYSLGITLYQMTTGKVPFSEGGSLYTIMQSHIRETPPPPREFLPSISPFLEQVILKAIEKKPEDRWRSCEEFKEALEKAIEQKAYVPKQPPVSARQAPAPIQTQPITRPQAPKKSSAWLPLLLILLVASVAVAGGGYFYYSKYLKERAKQPTTPTQAIAPKKQGGAIESPEPQATAKIPLVPPKRAEKKKTEISPLQKAPSPGKPVAEAEKEMHDTLQRAEQALKSGKFDTAATLAQKVLQKDPENVEAKTLLAEARQAKANRLMALKLDEAEDYLKSGKFAMALKRTDEVLKENPTNTRALKLKAEAHAALKKEQERKTAIEAKLAKSEAYLDSQRFRKAAQEAKGVLALDPGNQRARKIIQLARQGAKSKFIESKLAEGYQHLEAKQYALALKKAQEILNRFPQEPRAKALRREAVAGLKSTHSKEETVKRMLSRAERFLETGQFHKARVLADKILDMDPDNRRAQDILEIAQEEENKQLFQRFLGQGAPATEGGSPPFPVEGEGGAESPATPIPVLPIPGR
ncbi:MAG: protein kinase [Deltaproteobacteria bacterium]|nr:protein kinase [Deltaproteobacteria bacterium]MBW1928574.1 protein kinase [Deltaproteobacteria bacterium]MBW2025302.1 protein kinase [Deltaproteobacteria bacterium]RLB22332.1 MAG: hypothetical protein DRG76_06955 [Deltaproteobacteria bacterium]